MWGNGCGTTQDCADNHNTQPDYTLADQFNPETFDAPKGSLHVNLVIDADELGDEDPEYYIEEKINKAIANEIAKALSQAISYAV